MSIEAMKQALVIIITISGIAASFWLFNYETRKRSKPKEKSK